MRNLETAKSKSLNIENFIATRSKYIHYGLYSGEEKKRKLNQTIKIKQFVSKIRIVKYQIFHNILD